MRKDYMHSLRSKFVTVVPLTSRGIVTMYCMDQKCVIAQFKILILTSHDIIKAIKTKKKKFLCLFSKIGCRITAIKLYKKVVKNSLISIIVLGTKFETLTAGTVHLC